MKNYDLEVLIKDFNRKDTILVISKYPYKNIGESFHGVAVYTKDTLETIAKKTKQKFVVLVEEKYGRPFELKADGSILVLPSFKQHPVKVFKQLYETVNAFDQIKNIQLHSEFYNSGDLLQMSLLLPFLYILRLQGKIVSFIAHNVVHDFSFLSNHLGKNNNSWKLNLLSKFIPWYYQFLSFGVEQLITLDESIRERLGSYLWQKDKIKATSIWLKNKRISKVDRISARRKLALEQDDLVITVFGFMSRYKGVDLLLQNFLRFKKEFPQSKFKLLLAGGMAPSQKNQKHYLDFYKNLENLAAKHEDITLSGFIEEKDLRSYMALTDVVLLPYRGILGASASWATVLSYGKACFFSKALEPYFMATDVQLTLKSIEANKEDLLFNTNYQSFKKLLLSLTKNESRLEIAKKFSSTLRMLRDENVCVFRDFPPLYFPRSCNKRAQACYNLGNEEIVA